MLSDRSNELLKDEIANNNLLQINSLNTRNRAVAEFKKRFSTCDEKFWDHYQNTVGTEHQLLYFFVLLRTYRILLDLHLRVTVRRFMAADETWSSEAIRQEFDEIAVNDEFVDSWTDMTKKKISSTYQTILRKIGFLEESSDTLHAISQNANDYRYFLENGEIWFLEACFLRQYEINNMRSALS